MHLFLLLKYVKPLGENAGWCVCEWKGKYLSGCKVARTWGGPLTSI